MTNIAIIVGAGRGSRAGEGLPKQYRAVGGMSLMRRNLLAFHHHPRITSVCAVIHPDDAELFTEAADGLDILCIVHGGDTRQESVFNGLRAIGDSKPEHVLIHDAARPFVSETIISRVLDALARHAGALPALAVVDTLKQSNSENLIEKTVPRQGLWRAQTPQGFRYDDIIKAHMQCQNAKDYSDDASIAEASGLDVIMVEGDENNIKVTTPEDFARAESMAANCETRTGQGFDVHRFGRGDHVTLCGVDIPHSHSLQGHSDADVAMHALTDALYGCVGAGDIGHHFPPDQAEWRGAASDIFLSHARDTVNDLGGRIINVDVTIICESPKIGPHRDAMRKRVSEILEIDIPRVSIKATTTEKLGFTGRGEGIAAQAMATVSLPLGD